MHLESNKEIQNKNDIKNNIFDFDKRIIEEDIDTQFADCFSKFEPSYWNKLNDTEKYISMINLNDVLSNDLNLKEKPNVMLFSSPEKGERGYYDQGEKAIFINIENFDNPNVIAKTMAHECRHCWQRERCTLSLDKLNDFDNVLKFNFENYVSPNDNYRAYLMQPVEVDARLYADKISETYFKGVI